MTVSLQPGGAGCRMGSSGYLALNGTVAALTDEKGDGAILGTANEPRWLRLSGADDRRPRGGYGRLDDSDGRDSGDADVWRDGHGIGRRHPFDGGQSGGHGAMIMRRSSISGLPMGTRGIALLEVMIAAVILLIVFFGLAQFYTRGRMQIDYEEDRRRATAVLQARLDGIRSDFRYDDLATLSGQDTTYTIENKAYRVHHEITSGAPEAQASTLDLTVTWTARAGTSVVNRSMVTTTFLGRGMP